MMIPFNSDAYQAAVTAAAQQITAYAERNGIPLTPDQCHDLAETLMSHYQSFFAGVRFATERAPQGDQ